MFDSSLLQIDLDPKGSIQDATSLLLMLLLVHLMLHDMLKVCSKHVTSTHSPSACSCGTNEGRKKSRRCSERTLSLFFVGPYGLYLLHNSTNEIFLDSRRFSVGSLEH